MRKLLTLLMAIVMMVNTTNAAFTESKTESKVEKASKSAFSNTEKRQAAEFFVKLSRKEYEQLSGRHLSLAERLSFKISQNQLKKALKRESETEGFNIGGFALGFFLGVIGLLIAYLAFKDDNLRKWALIGFGAAVVFSIILLVILLAALNKN